ncbi:MAG: molybdenum cofactor biosynthesis protein B [Candidatus Wukongarchaeota archaeon]|nr:molybdenum cofactor biosynthesis protein B [Candidatus Wukongarchaeota archaeon]MDO8129474.1 molybdenum cofactor biosynthesis protein B [Candidatus Wukongarchaeota archaeon]
MAENETLSVVKAHKKDAPKHVKVWVIVVSDSKYEMKVKGLENADLSGSLITKLFVESGHSVEKYEIVPDSGKLIEEQFETFLRSSADLIVFSGGTGISKRDITVETIKPKLGKILEGFGELFRYLSYKEIGAAAFLSRAFSGVIDRKIVFCLPGSPNAVKLAVEKLILPEIGHVVKIVRR